MVTTTFNTMTLSAKYQLLEIPSLCLLSSQLYVKFWTYHYQSTLVCSVSENSRHNCYLFSNDAETMS